MPHTYAIAPPLRAALPVAGTGDYFPLRRVYCVGRNYASHTREMGNDDREPPFFFLKPTDAVVPTEGAIPYPPLTSDLHHEIELVVAIATRGANIAPGDALDHVFGYAVGVDLTRRDLQTQAKKMSRPWDWGKSFDNAAPCGTVHPVARTGHPSSGRIWLSVNDEIRQDGDLAELIWPVRDIVSICSRASRLEPGDLIFTGTPAGVGAIQPGDKITGGIDGIGEINFAITAQTRSPGEALTNPT